ncbi:MAG: LPS biosynthesis protein, partial [Bacteroidetes bacterium]|nr:LPS biosynthesis protein [Bacteroidota bacterium]
DDAIVDLCNSLDVKVARGEIDDVLDRYYQSVKHLQAKWIVRVTSDCPLIDPHLIDEVISFAIKNKLEYCSNTLQPMFPDGQDVEVFSFDSLEKAYFEATLDSEKEHVTPYILKNSTYRNGKKFLSDNFLNTFGDYSKVRITLDEQNDFELLKKIIVQMGTNKTWKEYSDYIIKNKSVFNLNKHINRNEGLNKSLLNDKNY